LTIKLALIFCNQQCAKSTLTISRSPIRKTPHSIGKQKKHFGLILARETMYKYLWIKFV